MAEDKPVEQPKRWSKDWFASLPWIAIVRRSLAVLIAIALSLGTFGLFGLHICRDAIATVGSQAVVRTCGPASLTDLAPWAVVIALLLAPDFSQLDLFGVISLHREVKQQKERQVQLERDLFQVRTAVSQNVRVENILMAPEGRQVLAGVDQKTTRFLRESATDALTQTPPRSEPPASPQRAQMESALLRLWEELRDYLAILNEPTPSNISPFLLSPIGSVVAGWRSVFGDEIDLVRAARNSVAHAIPVSDDALADALAVGHKLLDALRTKLDEATRPSNAPPRKSPKR